MIIKNFKNIATTKERNDALTIINVGIESVLPSKFMPQAINYQSGILSVGQNQYQLSAGRLFVVGAGKASGAMAEELEKILGVENINEGLVISKNWNSFASKIKIVNAGHPVPDERNIPAAQEIMEFQSKYNFTKTDKVILLLSGGGGALLCLPAEGISLSDKQKTTQLLLKSGALIHEINIIRKHLSKIKGGRLAEHFQPAQVISLILSDVVGDSMDTIACGPTYLDPSTFEDTYDILMKYNIWNEVPIAIQQHIEKGRSKEVSETPKTIPTNAKNYLIATNYLALETMKEKAEALGYLTTIVESQLVGESSLKAIEIAKWISKQHFQQRTALIFGGETTVTIKGDSGLGGRNQEFALASMEPLNQLNAKWTLASVGSDGSDYLPDVAGGITDGESLKMTRALGLDSQEFLVRHDSHEILKQINGLVITGDTGTNVGDFLVYLINPN